jgi:hypothetical protein
MTTRFRGRDPNLWPLVCDASVRSFFANSGKHVIYFAGYGELGYEREGRVRQVALAVLSDWLPSEVLVHAGTLLREGGHDGIAEIYAIARALGIETSGIHPSVARTLSDTHRVSPYCDHVFFVQDETWGGLLEETDRPSPVLQLHLDVAHEMVLIGGGKHAADELRAFGSLGRQARYFPADMNHAVTRDWCERAGVAISDLRGAAHGVWEQLCPEVQVNP